MNIEKLLESMDKMLKDVGETSPLPVKRVLSAITQRRMWFLRDYVVVAQTHGPRPTISSNWLGPRRISRFLSDFTVKIEHLLSSATDVGHVCCVKPYADA